MAVTGTYLEQSADPTAAPSVASTSKSRGTESRTHSKDLSPLAPLRATGWTRYRAINKKDSTQPDLFAVIRFLEVLQVQPILRSVQCRFLASLHDGKARFTSKRFLVSMLAAIPALFSILFAAPRDFVPDFVFTGS